MAISKDKAIKKLIVTTVLTNTIKRYTNYEERKTVTQELWKKRTSSETEYIQQIKNSIIEIRNTAIEYFITEDSWTQRQTIEYIKNEIETLFVIEWRDVVMYPEDFIFL